MLVLVCLLATSRLAAQCSLSCPTAVNLALAGPASGCISILTPALLGARSQACTGLIDVDLLDARGQVIPGAVDSLGARTGVVKSEYIGQRLRARILDRSSGSSCLVFVSIFDSSPPTLIARDTSISALSATDAKLMGGPLPDAQVADCSGVSLSYVDSIGSMLCGTNSDGSGSVRVIYRRWLAVDAAGSTSTAIQIVDIQRMRGADLLAPRDTSFDCAFLPNLTLAFGHLWIAPGGGYPKLSTQALDGYLDDVYWTHHDERFNGPGGTFQILRTWRVYDACAPVATGSNPRNLTQRIAIRDLRGPSIELQTDTVRAYVDGSSCAASVLLTSATVIDACDPAPSISVRLGSVLLPQNGGRFNNVPLGDHVAVYTARDASGNQTQRNVIVQVSDRTAPALTVHPVRTFSLPSASAVSVRAEGYDAGTYEACGPYTLAIRRLGDSVFAASIQIDCRDLGRDLQLEIEASDYFNNRVIARVQAQVRDFLPPQITPPAGLSVRCEDVHRDLSLYGRPQVLENCSYSLRDSLVDRRDACGLGNIERYWIATDAAGLKSQASQVIRVIADAGFGESRIVWPRDTTLTCAADADTSLLGLKHRAPIVSAQPCAGISMSFSDRHLKPPSSCGYIERSWSVIDLCRYTGGSEGLFTHVQRISIDDRQAPQLFGVPTILELVSNSPDCAGTELNPSAWRAEDCTAVLPVLIRYRLLQQAGSTAASYQAWTVTTRFIPGRYNLEVSATDACGNAAVQTVALQVRDGNPPIVRCKPSVTLEYPGAGLPINAQELDLGSSDACAQNLTLFTDAKSPTCAAWRQAQTATLYVNDAAGNSATCTTTILWQGGETLCPADQINVSGRITTSRGEALPAKFELSGATSGNTYPGFATAADGRFGYEAISEEDLLVTPSTVHDVLRGVTSYDLFLIGRHILGVNVLPVGPPRWAADVNRSGGISAYDITVARRVMLGLETSMPGGVSYRLVAKSADGQPLADGSGSVRLNRSYALQTPSWLAVKLADVSGTSLLTSGPPALGPRTAESSPGTWKLRLVPTLRIKEYALVVSETGRLWAAGLSFEAEEVRLSAKLAVHALQHEAGVFTKVSVYAGQDGVELLAGDTLAFVRFSSDHVPKGLVSGEAVVSSDDVEAREFAVEVVHGLEFGAEQQVLATAVYPNPVRAGQTLRLQAEHAATTLVGLYLVDANGRQRQLDFSLIAPGPGGSSTAIGQDLSPGIYMLIMLFADGRQASQRLVISH